MPDRIGVARRLHDPLRDPGVIMTNAHSSVRNSQTLWQLRSFCRGEMSAAESYTTALLHDNMVPHAYVLTRCRDSHAARARMLRDRIQKLGGAAPRSSGPWGALADIFEEAAADLGVRPAIIALEEGEYHGMRDYRADLDLLDSDTQAFIQREILPAQVETCRNIEKLHETLH
jgi:hypothetical protein